MEDSILESMVRMEEELAALYSKIKKLSRFDPIKDVLQYLIVETLSHARKIDELKKKPIKPVLQVALIPVLFEKIKETLFNTLVQEKSYNKSIDKMAGMEDNLGKIYKTIASYYSNLSDYYKSHSDLINQIMLEEIIHKEKLLSKKHNIV